jgi:hypothetical protein
MTRIVGVPALMAKFRQLQKEASQANVTVVTGFTQRYVIYVHEMLELKHDPGKQAKFLGSPSIWLRGVMAAIVVETYLRTRSVLKGLLLAGSKLQVAAQDIAPIDTSAMYASAFTCEEKDYEAVSQAAFIKSEGIRKAELASRAKGKSFKGRMLNIINKRIAKRRAKGP